jgi:hypothetical protein
MATTRTAKKTAQAQRDNEKTTAPARKSPAKKTPARKPAAKKTLPTRSRDWMTDAQGFAVLAARIVGINTPRIQDWTDHHDGTVTRALNDGTLHYTVTTRTLRWQATCRMGAVHTYLIADPSSAAAARVRAETCTQLHADLTSIEPLTTDELKKLGVHTGTTLASRLPGEDPITETIPVPLLVKPRALGDALTRATSTTADTQPLSHTEIAAGLTARADNDQPMEHPEP